MEAEKAFPMATALMGSVIFQIMRKCMVFGGSPRNTSSTFGSRVFGYEQLYTCCKACLNRIMNAQTDSANRSLKHGKM